jgi:hypothetical protein
MSNAPYLPGHEITDEACLSAVMTARGLSGPCSACGFGGERIYFAKQKAFGCRHCGFKLYPCEGTPFAGSRRSLSEWFLAMRLAARESRPLTGRALSRLLGIRADTAEEIASTVEQLRNPDPVGIDWFDVARGVGRSGVSVPPPPGAAATAVRMLRAPAAGFFGIALGAALAAGAVSLAVPAPPPEQGEHAAASVALALAAEGGVVLVTPEAAERLYDVSDLDQEAPSPLAAQIRIVAKPGAPAADKPAALPAIKLAASVGQSLLRGDYAGVRNRAGERPELAAYGALAKELQAGNTGNPDDLLTFGPVRIRRHLVDKIVRAASATKMDPVLLMAIADKESSFATEVQAKTSSATGLFQFIESTWLRVVRDYGARYGLAAEAVNAVALVSGSNAAGPEERRRILDLRRDAYLSAVLAAEMLKNDSAPIAARLGRPLTGGEIYLVHFLGPDGAMRLLERARSAPDDVAADLLPKPAAANRTIFFTTDQSGAAKGLSVSEVRAKFESMIGLRLDRYRAVRSTPAAPGERTAVR